MGMSLKIRVQMKIHLKKAQEKKKIHLGRLNRLSVAEA